MKPEGVSSAGAEARFMYTAEEGGEGGGGEGEYSSGGVALAEEQLAFTVGKFHTFIPCGATGVRGLLPLDHALQLLRHSVDVVLRLGRRKGRRLHPTEEGSHGQ
jgi:hypothetical protein